MSDYVVVRQVVLTGSHRPTGRTRHYRGSTELPAPSTLRIIQLPPASGYYLLYLDREERELTDTYHDTLDDAMAQAEWEFSVRPEEWTEPR
jgi:hypothetical protein